MIQMGFNHLRSTVIIQDFTGIQFDDQSVILHYQNIVPVLKYCEVGELGVGKPVFIALHLHDLVQVT